MIDLTRFSTEKVVIAPIVDGWGKCEGRKIESSTQDGWYLVKLANAYSIERPATSLEVYKALKQHKFFQVYVFGEEGISVNFDIFQKRGWKESVKVNFIKQPLYTVSKIVEWEDGRFYYFENSPSNGSLGQQLRSAQNNSQWASSKGITPELGYYLLLITLSGQAFREVNRLDKLNLSVEEKEKRVKQFANKTEERLKKTIEEAGGKFIEYKKDRGNNILVTWEVGGQTVKSQINSENFGIVSAGFCLSGDDKRHTMGSIVRLAEDFQEEADLYITRE